MGAGQLGQKTEAGKAWQRAAVLKTGGLHKRGNGRESAQCAGAGRVGRRHVYFKYDNHAPDARAKAARSCIFRYRRPHYGVLQNFPTKEVGEFLIKI